MELFDKYKNYQIEFIEVEPLPKACIDCKDDCGSCENAGERWYLSKKNQLIIKRKYKIKAVERLLREINQIDAELEVLEK